MLVGRTVCIVICKLGDGQRLWMAWKRREHVTDIDVVDGSLISVGNDHVYRKVASSRDRPSSCVQGSPT